MKYSANSPDFAEFFLFLILHAGFIDGTNTGDDYQYDEFGNMTSDLNKGIMGINYNHLNLPTQIVFGTGGIINYVYNAQGVKMQKIVSYPNNTQATTLYRGGFQYDNQTLQFVHMAEGYIKHTINPFTTNPTIGAYHDFDYVYNYTDHLGNIRLSYTLDPSGEGLKVMEENHYYPFGLKHTYNLDRRDIGYEEFEQLNNTQDTRRTRMVNNNGYQYKYNGKEWQDELGLAMYDYGARNYDPAIGRWMNMDPKAEEDRRWTPYRYAYNNPLRFIDPDGMLEDDYLLNDDGSFTLIAETNTPDRVFNDQGNFVELEYDGQIKESTVGTYEGVDYKSISFKSDQIAEQAFEFFSINSSVEFSHVQTDKGSFVSTSGKADVESGGVANISNSLSNGGVVLKFNHSHPFYEKRNQAITNSILGIGGNKYVPGSSEADREAAKTIHKYFPNAKLNVFDSSSWQYIPFNEHRDIKK
jgi:RHS repeat-associated protein